VVMKPARSRKWKRNGGDRQSVFFDTGTGGDLGAFMQGLLVGLQLLDLPSLEENSKAKSSRKGFKGNKIGGIRTSEEKQEKRLKEKAYQRNRKRIPGVSEKVWLSKFACKRGKQREGIEIVMYWGWFFEKNKKLQEKRTTVYRASPNKRTGKNSMGGKGRNGFLLFAWGVVNHERPEKRRGLNRRA